MLTKENTQFVLELKETLLIMRDKPSLNKSIRSAPLYLFGRVQLRLTPVFGVLRFS